MLKRRKPNQDRIRVLELELGLRKLDRGDIGTKSNWQSLLFSAYQDQFAATLRDLEKPETA